MSGIATLLCVMRIRRMAPGLLALGVVALAGCSAGAPDKIGIECYELRTGGDREVLRIEYRKQEISGFYGWFPAEKDRHWGDFTGSLDNGVIDGTLIAHGEGQVSDEPLHLLTGDRTVTIRTWELVGKADGRYLVPWSELRSLPQVSCDELDVP